MLGDYATLDEQTPLLQGNDHVQEVSQSTKDSQEKRYRGSVSTTYRIAATYYSFIVVGAWDGSYGGLVIYLRDYYNLSYLAISFALLAPVVGYAVAAFVNSTIHNRFGQRGVAIIASSCHCIAAFSAGQRPPYSVLIVIFMVAGLGNGIADASWNSWIGSMPQGNGLMGLLHGFYGVGAACSPLLASLLIEHAGLPWHQFYRALGCASILELATTSAAFWGCTAKILEATKGTSSPDYASPKIDNESQGDAPILQAFRYPSTWIISLFVFLYAGIEISLADWISSYLIDVRSFDRRVGNLNTFGYWVGLTAGRVIVGFLASRINWGKRTVTGCSLLCFCACAMFYLTSGPASSAISITLIGFFLGPLFPEAVVMQAKILPKRMHLAAIGFAVAFGSAGGSVVPFLVGLAADKLGIVVLQWFVVGMLGGCVGCWLLLPTSRAECSSSEAADHGTGNA